jgi:NADH-quinone oxidoreductase subunit E
MLNTSQLLSDDLRSAIRALLPRYPTSRAATLPALHLVQDGLGHVPARAIVEIAELLELAPAQVLDTMSFYGFFAEEKPLGRTRIWVCRSLSCATRGGEDLLEYLCDKLGIRLGETTPDGRATVQYAECLGLCDGAPAMLANDVVYTDLTKEKIDRFVESLQ